MDSYLPLQINARVPYSVYYRTHPNKSPSAIFICCLEKALKKVRVKKWFLHCGKIQSIELGEISKDGKTISHAVVEFKHKQGLRRSMDNAWLEQKISEELGTAPLPVDTKVEKHLNRMEEDGFTLVLPKKPKSNKFDLAAQSQEAVGSKRKNEVNDFYNFQITDKKSLKKMKAVE